MNSLHISLQPQPILTARCASFASRRSYGGYALSRELTHRTRQDGFHLTEGDIQ
jgi:hypothetical protein